MEKTGRGVVATDLVIAASSAFNFAMTLGAAEFAPAWWLTSAVVGTVTWLSIAWADRSRVGLWALIVVGAVGIAAIGWTAIADALPIGLVSGVFLGLAVGVALNRICFGIVRPVPEPRRRRYRSG